MEELLKNNEISFEEIKHIDEFGMEYWYARELMRVLEYGKWENFEKVIKKAKDACQNTGIDVVEHFPEVRKLSKRANNAEVLIDDYKLDSDYFDDAKDFCQKCIADDYYRNLDKTEITPIITHEKYDSIILFYFTHVIINERAIVFF